MLLEVGRMPPGEKGEENNATTFASAKKKCSLKRLNRSWAEELPERRVMVDGRGCTTMRSRLTHVSGGRGPAAYAPPSQRARHAYQMVSGTIVALVRLATGLKRQLLRARADGLHASSGKMGRFALLRRLSQRAVQCTHKSI